MENTQTGLLMDKRSVSIIYLPNGKSVVDKRASLVRCKLVQYLGFFSHINWRVLNI